MKEDKQGYIIIIVVLAIIGLIGVKIYKSIKEEEKSYEYALNGIIGVSSNCYYSNDAYCEIDNKVIKVDCYYEVEK